MKRLATTTLGALVLVLGAVGTAFSHCEIPCGIYGDKARIDMLYEHTQTMEKSMRKIAELTGETDAQSANQLVRWIDNKEEHAEAFQEIVWQYFMTQRIKAPAEGDEAARAQYLERITTLHAMLRGAMKCKQTVDTSNAADLRARIDRFSESYLSEEDLEHIRAEHGEHGDG